VDVYLNERNIESKIIVNKDSISLSNIDKKYLAIFIQNMEVVKKWCEQAGIDEKDAEFKSQVLLYRFLTNELKVLDNQKKNKIVR